jgi:Glycosyltransferases, probably involved in cell wall biogenesis
VNPRLSVVVPAYNAGRDLSECLRALLASDLPRAEWELLVVDDGSSDDTADRAAHVADSVIRLPEPPRGPAAARNRGAEQASAPVVAFIDADVEVHPDALGRMLAAFDSDPALSAVFGSYDDDSRATGIVSQYRNLLHHFVHQRNAGSVESFWAGCGAVRKSALMEAGKFDEVRYGRPEMEDVDLGYRLRDAGRRIALDPAILCTHRKRWTLSGMIRSDFSRRGVPWTRLLLERRMLLAQKGLSMGDGERWSVVLAGVTAVLVVAALLWRSVALAAALIVTVAIFTAVNRALFSWLRRARGAWFAVVAVLLHLVYNWVAVSAVLWSAVLHQLRSHARTSAL